MLVNQGASGTIRGGPGVLGGWLYQSPEERNVSQAQGPLLAWAAAYLGVEMPEPLSREGMVAGLGQGIARDSPEAPAARAQEHSLVKAFVLDLPHSGGWAPMVPCVSVYLCVCVHTLYVFAGLGSLCQREMLPVLGWRWGSGQKCGIQCPAGGRWPVLGGPGL